ncbi:MAG TPA: SAM-dependent methyltransferase [Candidatus Angelobacter sp.]|nr:SAM-dependent methyltransferase [Candidatus Angelobacter sp.]
MSTPAVSHVSDTARWVAMYRAMESERPDALFHDRWARKLAGPEGEAMLRTIPRAKQTAWPMVVRTQVMDELILQVLRDDQVDTVLNLAAGLDVRPYRLPLRPSLRWIDADLPGILGYKEKQMAGERPHCPVEFVQIDLADEKARSALFERVGGSSTKTLVIAEGLTVYLQPEQVARLSADLAAQPAFRWWLIDLASPRLLKRLDRMWGKTLQRAPMLFGPAEGTKFFEPHGWRELEFRSTMDESVRLQRSMPLAGLFRWVGKLYPKRLQEEFRRMSGTVLLERT